MPKTLQMKKVVAVFLVAVFILQLLTTLPAFAAVNVEMRNGKILFEATSKKASTGTRYRTTGWMVHQAKAYGDPITIPHGKMLKMTGQDVDNGDGTITTYFTIAVSDVNDALRAANMTTIKPGTTIYLSSIFQIVQNGEILPTKYYTKEDIVNAKPWANPGDFNQYYDVPVTFNPVPSDVTFVLMREDGSWINSGKVGTYMPGAEVTHVLPLKSGSLELYKSYLQNPVTGSTSWIVNGNSPNSRYFTNGVDGVRVVGQYKEVKQPPPTTPPDPKPDPEPDPSKPPNVTVTASVDPTSYLFKGSDVTVTINVTAKLNNYSGPLSNIQYWRIFAREDTPTPPSQQKNYDPTYYDKTLSISKSFTFTIPASKLSSVESYTQNYVVRPRVYFSETKYYDDLADNLSTYVYKSTAPPPKDPPPTSTNNPPVAVIDVSDKNVSKGDTIYVNGNDSYDPDGDSLEYFWSISPSTGWSGNLSGASGGSITIEESGSYDIKLIVSDGELGDEDEETVGALNGPPVARLSMPSSVFQGGTVTLNGSSSYDPDGDPLDYDWDISPSSGWSGSLSGPAPSITFTEEGEYTVDLEVDDGEMSDSDSDTIEVTNTPPVAVIDIPSYIEQGLDIEIESDSYDEDEEYGDTFTFDWTLKYINEDGTKTDVTPGVEIKGPDQDLTKETNNLYFDKYGNYELSLYVEDSWGKNDTETITFEVKPAIPTAYFEFYDSYYKQNRLVQIDGTGSTGSVRYPVDFSKTEWQYVPPAGVNANQAKVESSTDLSKRRLIFKEPGNWKVRMRVTNTVGNQSEWFERQIGINSDTYPIVDFKVDSSVTRDANNQKKAAIKLQDLTVSNDMDIISKRRWTYKFDSDNDGSFVDESWVTLSDTNNPTPTLYSDRVGNYIFELYVEESFGQPTLSQFIMSGDLRTGNTDFKSTTEKQTEVINLKPVVSFSPVLKKKVDLVMTVGQVAKSKVADLTGKINTQMVTKFAANGIDARISSVETTALSTQSSFAWQEYSHYSTDSAYDGDYVNGTFTNNHIVQENGGKTITFYGYSRPAYKDFLFLPDNQQSKKTFSFEVNEAQTDWHTLEGAGYLFNAKIENGILSGYAILLAQANIQLWEINGVNANQFHEGSYNSMSSFATLIGSYPKNGTQHSIVVEATPNKIDMWDNQVKIIDAQALNNQYGNGFGPMASYVSHSCSSLSYITFKNITMETTTGKSFDEVVKEPNWRENSNRFIANINDVELPEFNDPAKTPIIYSRLLNDNIDFSLLGTDANKSQANRIISTNDGHGIWINNYNLNTALSAYADYIINIVNQRAQMTSSYVLLDQEIDYTTTYEDSEKDPEIERRWQFSHTNPYYFQNSLGVAPYNGQWLPGAITKFSHVGEFTATFQAKDEPRRFDGTFNSVFDNYRMWSLIANPVKLYVHRKPIAMYTAALSKANAYDFNLAVSDTSYDLDHEFESDKGIVQRQWKWMYEEDTTWKNGKPPTYIRGGKTVIIYLRVKDIEGVWSDPEVRVMTTTGNMAPVANFSFSPNPLPLSKALTYEDFSYDPNSDPIVTYHWRSQPASGGSWTDHGNSPGGSSFASTAPKRFGAVGDYRIELTVKDSQGAVSEPFYQVVKVIPDNRKPIAKFTISPACAVPQDVTISYTDQSYDPDGDALVKWEWRYKKTTSSVWINVSSPPTDLSSFTPGDYQIQLRVKDNPALPQLDPLWSDWYTACGGVFKVLPANNKPVAVLNINPTPVPSDEPLNYTDRSTDPEGKNLQAYEMILTQLESGVSRTFSGTYSKGSGTSLDMSSRFIRIFETSGFPDDGAGTYEVKYRVQDTSPNGMSPALWSDWQTQEFIVEDPLSLEGAVHPPVARSGEAIQLTASTEGKSEEVIARIDWNQDGDYNDEAETVPLTSQYAVTSKLNDWSATVIIPLPTKDDNYTVTFTAKKTSPWDGSVKYVTDNDDIVTVRGDVFDGYMMEYYE